MVILRATGSWATIFIYPLSGEGFRTRLCLGFSQGSPRGDSGGGGVAAGPFSCQREGAGSPDPLSNAGPRKELQAARLIHSPLSFTVFSSWCVVLSTLTTHFWNSASVCVWQLVKSTIVSRIRQIRSRGPTGCTFYIGQLPSYTWMQVPRRV